MDYRVRSFWERCGKIPCTVALHASINKFRSHWAGGLGIEDVYRSLSRPKSVRFLPGGTQVQGFMGPAPLQGWRLPLNNPLIIVSFRKTCLPKCGVGFRDVSGLEIWPAIEGQLSLVSLHAHPNLGQDAPQLGIFCNTADTFLAP